MSPDYQAAIGAAAIFDTSAAGKLVLTGPDAPMFLGNLCTNDIKNLPLGGGCEAYFCDARAKVQFAAWIDHVMFAGDHAMWVETTPGRGEALAKYLDRYLISERVEIADRSAEFLQFHLAGPGAKIVLEQALRESLPDLPEFAHLEREFGRIRRRDLLGVPGFDIVCKERPRLDAVAGSPETFETLRIEAGTPLVGPDIDENRFVMEAGRAARAVSYAKGCYLGQEPIVMARDRAGHVNRAFLGMKVLDGGPLPPGTKLFRDGQEVGVVTSSCHSPRLGVPVALGYLRWKHQDSGLRLESESKQAVEVIGLPPVK
ncbi:MAG: glycine cleavage T C-terminal barrel domain-containing protein [Gemmataceae bacterium]